MSAIQSGVYRLGRDAELRRTNSGEAVSGLSLAYNYGKKDADGKQATTWIEAALWGKRAESASQYLTKGTQIFAVLSDLRLEHFNKADGTPGVKIAARVDSFDFIPGQRDAGQAPVARPQQSSAPAPARAQQRPAPVPAGSGFDDLDDDIPF
jgi:single-strand DNA-binding protein